MEEALGVPPARGLVRFVPVAERHLAVGGKTVAAEIEELERVSEAVVDCRRGEKRRVGDSRGSRSGMMKRRLSIRVRLTCPRTQSASGSGPG